MAKSYAPLDAPEQPYGGATYDSGDGTDASVRELTYDDEAETPAGPQFVSGTFKPAAASRLSMGSRLPGPGL